MTENLTPQELEALPDELRPTAVGIATGYWGDEDTVLSEVRYLHFCKLLAQRTLALQFYADRENWPARGSLTAICNATFDRGHRACKALEETP